MNHNCVPRTLGLACLMLIGSAQAGTIYSSVYANADAYQTIQLSDSKDNATNQSSLNLNASSALDYRGASASAYAALGVTKAASYAVSGGLHGASSSASAGWNDTLLYSNNSLNGTHGSVTLNFYYAYAFDLINQDLYPSQVKTVRATYTNEVFASGTSSRVAMDLWLTGTSLYGYQDHTSIPHRQSINVDFIWGQAFTIANSLSTSCAVGYNLAEPFASCNVDSYHSSYWDGFMDLKSNGALVADYELSSGSGTDYSHSFVPKADIPEPVSIGLFSLGGLMLLTARRQHKTKYTA